MCIDERMCSRTAWSETKNRYMCITAQQEHIEVNKTSTETAGTADHCRVLCVYVCTLFDWICRGLSQNHNLEIDMVACKLEMCKGVLSLLFFVCMKANKKCVRSPAALSQTPNSTIAQILHFRSPTHLTTIAVFVYKSKDREVLS